MIEAAKFGGLCRFKLKVGDMEEHVMRKNFLSCRCFMRRVVAMKAN